MDSESLQKLIADGLSQREIAFQLNKSQTTLRFWLKKYGLTTGNLKQPREKPHNCNVCGETEPNKFYGNDKLVCGACHNERVKKAGREKRSYAIGKLGGKCRSCGFDKYECSLDVHHTSPTQKDPNFASMRGWSLSRIDNELQTCILLCKNCHSAHHSGLLSV